jgi:hypothetical protein
MIDSLIRDLQILRKADFIIAKIWLGVLLRRLGLIAFAGLIGIFGLGMANIAGYYVFEASLGAVRAAAIVALGDLSIAGIMLLVASRSRPGSELDLAFEVRKMAVNAIQADARDVTLTLTTLGKEVSNVKANITQFMQNPLELAAKELLVPAVLSILRGLRTNKERA